MPAAGRKQLREGAAGSHGSPRGCVQHRRWRLRGCFPGQVAKRFLEEFSRNGFYRLDNRLGAPSNWFSGWLDKLKSHCRCCSAQAAGGSPGASLDLRVLGVPGRGSPPPVLGSCLGLTAARRHQCGYSRVADTETGIPQV